MRRAVILVAFMTIAAPVYAQGQNPGTERDRFQSFGYARLGYGGVFADRTHGAPAIGFGFRGELESFALDVSFLNYLITSNTYGSNAFAGSVLRLQALRFVNPGADSSPYVGGGFSWGGVSAEREQTPATYVTSWHGSGLQAEVTVGYELARTSPIRLFVQADIGLPLFNARSETMAVRRTSPAVVEPASQDKRYIPSAAVSVGIGWSRH